MRPDTVDIRAELEEVPAALPTQILLPFVTHLIRQHRKVHVSSKVGDTRNRDAWADGVVIVLRELPRRELEARFAQKRGREDMGERSEEQLIARALSAAARDIGGRANADSARVRFACLAKEYRKTAVLFALNE